MCSLTEGGLGIPVVLVVVEGGTDAIDDAKNSLSQNIPVVVCAGTGRAADLLSYAYQHAQKGYVYNRGNVVRDNLY